MTQTQLRRWAAMVWQPRTAWILASLTAVILISSSATVLLELLALVIAGAVASTRWQWSPEAGLAVLAVFALLAMNGVTAHGSPPVHHRHHALRRGDRPHGRPSRGPLHHHEGPHQGRHKGRTHHAGPRRHGRHR